MALPWRRQRRVVPALLLWSKRLAFSWVAPVAALIAYSITLSLRAADLSTATFLYSDAPESAYLGAGIAAGHPVTLASHSEAAALLLSGWLLRLPAGHAMVQALAAVPALAAIALLCLCLRRLGASWPLVLVAGLSAGPIALWDDLWPTAHAFTLFGSAVLALVVVRRHSSAWRRRGQILAMLVAGVTVVDDPTFAFAGLAPLLATIAVLWFLRRSRRDLVETSLFLAGSLVMAAVTEVAFRIDGVQILFGSAGNPGGLDVSRVPIAITLAIHEMATLLTGGWYDTVLPQPWGAFALLAGGLVLVAAPLVLVGVLRKRRTLATPDPVVAYCTFWAAVDVCVIGMYLVLGLSKSPDGAHYLIPCLMSAVATVPLVAMGPRSAAALRTLAACTASCATLGVATVPATAFAGRENPPLDAQRILTVLTAQHLDRGYADYWVSHPLSWLSNEQVRVYPVTQNCASNPAAICDYEFSDATWYRPGHGPTFVILRRNDVCVNRDPSGALGPPLRTISIDTQTEVLVYDYDVASRFQPANRAGCFP